MFNFSLTNIKGFTDTGEIEIKPITVIIGENSSGKSSIIRFPLVLRQTFLDASMAPLLFYGKTIDYGNYEDVVFGHEKNRTIRFSIRIDGTDISKLRTFFFNDSLIKKVLKDGITLHVTIKNDGKNLKISNMSVLQNTKESNLLIAFMHDEKSKKFTVSTFDRQTVDLSEEEVSFDKFLPDFRFLNIIQNNSRVFVECSGLFRALSYYFNNMTKNIFYIGPFRKTPERFYRYIENSVDYVGRDGEFAPVILGQDLRANGKLVKEVSQWLEKHLKFSLAVEDLKGDLFKLVIKDLKTNAVDNIIDVGHGLSQLIPIIVQVFMKKNTTGGIVTRFEPDNLHIIEQPELHLHPAAQASLADLFVEATRTKKGAKRNYFLIETNSEYMLLRLRRYIVEGKISLDDINLYYTEKDKKNGCLVVKPLEINNEGGIPNWPKGFFSQDYEETLAIKRALDKKQNREESVLW